MHVICTCNDMHLLLLMCKFEKKGFMGMNEMIQDHMYINLKSQLYIEE